MTVKNSCSHGDYYVKVEVTFSAFPMTYRNTYDLLVRLKPSCQDDTFTGATWISSGVTTVSVYDHKINIDTDVHAYSARCLCISRCVHTHMHSYTHSYLAFTHLILYIRPKKYSIKYTNI